MFFESGDVAVGCGRRPCFFNKRTTSLCLSLFLVGLFLWCSNAVVTWAGTGEKGRPPSNDALKERIALLERALTIRTEGEELDRSGDTLGALLLYKKSDRLRQDAALEVAIKKMTVGASSFTRPDLGPLRKKIALLEELASGTKLLEGLFAPEPEGEGISLLEELAAGLESLEGLYASKELPAATIEPERPVSEDVTAKTSASGPVKNGLDADQ